MSETEGPRPEQMGEEPRPNLLPRLTSEVAESFKSEVFAVTRANPQEFRDQVTNLEQRLKKENPELLKAIDEMALTSPMPPVSKYSAIFTYEMLRRQAEVDKMNLEFRDKKPDSA